MTPTELKHVIKVGQVPVAEGQDALALRKELLPKVLHSLQSVSERESDAIVKSMGEDPEFIDLQTLPDYPPDYSADSPIISFTEFMRKIIKAVDKGCHQELEKFLCADSKITTTHIPNVFRLQAIDVNESFCLALLSAFNEERLNQIHIELDDWRKSPFEANHQNLPHFPEKIVGLKAYYGPITVPISAVELFRVVQDQSLDPVVIIDDEFNAFILIPHAIEAPGLTRYLEFLDKSVRALNVLCYDSNLSKSQILVLQDYFCPGKERNADNLTILPDEIAETAKIIREDIFLICCRLIELNLRSTRFNLSYQSHLIDGPDFHDSSNWPAELTKGYKKSQAALCGLFNKVLTQLEKIRPEAVLQTEIDDTLLNLGDFIRAIKQEIRVARKRQLEGCCFASNFCQTLHFEGTNQQAPAIILAIVAPFYSDSEYDDEYDYVLNHPEIDLEERSIEAAGHLENEELTEDLTSKRVVRVNSFAISVSKPFERLKSDPTHGFEVSRIIALELQDLFSFAIENRFNLESHPQIELRFYRLLWNLYPEAIKIFEGYEHRKTLFHEDEDRKAEENDILQRMIDTLRIFEGYFECRKLGNLERNWLKISGEYLKDLDETFNLIDYASSIYSVDLINRLAAAPGYCGLRKLDSEHPFIQLLNDNSTENVDYSHFCTMLSALNDNAISLLEQSFYLGSEFEVDFISIEMIQVLNLLEIAHLRSGFPTEDDDLESFIENGFITDAPAEASSQVNWSGLLELILQNNQQ